MAEAPNGLASLTKARESRARRTMPAPRHPVAVADVKPADLPPAHLPTALSAPLNGGSTIPDLSDAAAAVELARPAAADDPAEHTVRPVRVAQSGQRDTDQWTSVAAGSGPARPVTLYLDEAQIKFLEEAHLAGLLSTPRLDLSKSAVVRLALRRLKAQMSVEEIADLLRAQPTDPTKTGRKRR